MNLVTKATTIVGFLLFCCLTQIVSAFWEVFYKIPWAYFVETCCNDFVSGLNEFINKRFEK